MIGYTWQEKWDKGGYESESLISRYSDEGPSKLTKEQKNELKLLLKERDD